jgi:hypothetical protein
MARMRYMKPEFWTDGKIVKLGPWARLLFIGSWNFALCEAGHLDDDAMALKLKVLPADPIDADEVLGEVIASGRIVRRQLPDGRTYLHIVHLVDHQKVDLRWNSRCPYCAGEEAANLAGPPPASSNLSETQESSGESSETHQDSAQEGIGEERRGREGKGKNSRARADPPPPSFADFWAAYPNKDDRKNAQAKWDSAVNAGVDPAVILAAAIRYRDDPNRDPSFTKMAKTWLNGHCWENGPLPPRGGISRQRPHDDGFRSGVTLARRIAEQEAGDAAQLAIGESA